MLTATAYALTALIALGLIFIGARFLVAPRVAAVGYGVPANLGQPSADAYLSVKGVRDIATGLFVIILMLAGFAAIWVPFAAGIAGTIFFGCVVLVSGIAHWVYAWFERKARGVLWQILIGLIYFIAGVTMLLLPVNAGLTLLPEIRREHAGDAPLAEDLALLEGQVDRCRTILREMVAFGKAQLSQVPEQLTLASFIHGCLERFQLLRPEADLQLSMSEDDARTLLRTPRGLRHALINLLNNAVDASAVNGSQAVALTARCDQGWLELIVRDYGPGFTVTGEPAALGQSLKQTGLGIGLALAEATAERLEGELTADNTDNGAQMSLRLPLAVIAAP